MNPAALYALLLLLVGAALLFAPAEIGAFMAAEASRATPAASTLGKL